MSPCLRSLGCCAWLVLLPLPVSSADFPGFWGSVADNAGGSIPNSRVIVHWDPVAAGDSAKDEDNVGLKEDRIATTDSRGEFSLYLPPGVYDVFVSAAGFNPHCDKVTASAKGNPPYRVSLDPVRMIRVKVTGGAPF